MAKKLYKKGLYNVLAPVYFKNISYKICVLLETYFEIKPTHPYLFHAQKKNKQRRLVA